MRKHGDEWASDRDRDKRGWQRDAKGRAFRVEEGVNVYRDARERDQALEERYHMPWCCEDECCASVLAAVSRHGERELVPEFMAWIGRTGRRADDDEALHRWCVEIFGDRLYPAPLRLLRYHVRVALHGDPYKRGTRPAPQPRLTPGLTSEQRRDRMLAALTQNVEKHSMQQLGLQAEAKRVSGGLKYDVDEISE